MIDAKNMAVEHIDNPNALKDIIKTVLSPHSDKYCNRGDAFEIALLNIPPEKTYLFNLRANINNRIGPSNGNMFLYTAKHLVDERIKAQELEIYHKILHENNKGKDMLYCLVNI